MTRHDLCNEYFEWLYALVCEEGRVKRSSYRKLLTFLHNTEFTYTVSRDCNRSADGIDLRYRFAMFEHPDMSPDFITRCLDEPCSIFEMMTALSLRCEENIMDDPQIGNRTNQWFWGMIVSLGLGHMDDSRFDKGFVQRVINTFLNREYTPEGVGGLFTIKYCEKDLRDVEIWYQMCWYLNRLI